MSFVVGLDISGLDESFKAHAHRGIGRYVRELKKYFDECGRSGDMPVRFFNHKELQESGGLVLRAAAGASDLLPALKTTFKQQFLYPFQLQAAKAFDAYHFPAHMDPPAWGIKRYAVTVLDLIPLVCADLYKANKSGLRFHFARFLELQAIKNASLVLCISENTAKDVHNILKVPEERLIVTPLGVDHKFFRRGSTEDDAGTRVKYKIAPDRPVILYVGGIDPRKNWSVMLKAVKTAIENFRAQGRPAPVLLMAGSIQSDREFPRLQRLVKELGLERDVVMPGYVEDSELLKLYKIASVFFFPSLYEGFGLPPLEAMAAGVPVVSSSSSCMPEILGDAALMFDPADSLAASEALTAIILKEDLARQLREKGEKRAGLFTWEKTGQSTLDAYRRLAAL